MKTIKQNISKQRLEIHRDQNEEFLLNFMDLKFNELSE